MKAAVWYAKKDVRVMDVPEPPSPGSGKVKIKVEWCGICGSDLHEYLAGPIFIPVDAPHPLTGAKAPLILGHEFSGVITEVGEGVTDWKVGDRVAPDACQHCGECYLCKRNRYNICDVLAFTGLMADVAFECIGNHITAVQAIDCVRKAVTIMMVGIFEKASEVYFQNMTFTEKKIIGSLAYNGEFDTALGFVQDGRMKAEPLITGRIKLDDIIEKGFEELVNNKANNIKIIVDVNNMNQGLSLHKP